MDVYGGYYKLPGNRRELPVPWYCRAPLGLESGTTVHVAFVDGGPALGPAGGRNHEPRLPDVVVSVIEPDLWERTVIVTASCVDDKGLVHDLLDSLRKDNEKRPFVNIALGESVTTTGLRRRELLVNGASRPDRWHEMSFYCELLANDALERLNAWAERWKDSQAHHLGEVDIMPLPRPGMSPKLICSPTISDGCVQLSDDWEALVMQEVDRRGLSGQLRMYELSEVVCTADLRARSIRMIVPKKGTRQVRSRHRDLPNVLASTVQCIRNASNTILVHFLRREQPTFSIFQAVCEPTTSGQPLTESSFDELLHKDATSWQSIKVTGPDNYESLLFPPASLRSVGERVAFNVRKRSNKPDAPKRLNERERQLLRDLLDVWSAPRDPAMPEDPKDLSLAAEMLRASSRALPDTTALEGEIFRREHARLGKHSLIYHCGESSGKGRSVRTFTEACIAEAVEGRMAVDECRHKEAAVLFGQLMCASAAVFIAPPGDVAPHQASREAVCMFTLFQKFNSFGRAILLIERGSPFHLLADGHNQNKYCSVVSYNWPSSGITRSDHLEDGSLYMALVPWLNAL